MEELAGMKYTIIKQILKTFIEQEKKFFETCYFLINNFYKGMGVLEQSLPYQRTIYNPMKYIRANKLMEGVDIKSLPDIKMKEKYSINKKYSFEDYKLKKSNTNNINNNLNNNVNIIKNNQNSINNISTINNNNISQNNEKPLNPYSYEAYKRRTQSLDTLKKPIQNNNINNNNSNSNFYQSNLNLVMNSIIGNTKQINPFENMSNNNPYSMKENNFNNNPYSGMNNNIINNNNHINNNDDMENPYSSIFNTKNANNSNNNNNNNMNSIFNPYSGNYEQNNNNNNNFKKPQDKYNFGFD